MEFFNSTKFIIFFQITFWIQNLAKFRERNTNLKLKQIYVCVQNRNKFIFVSRIETNLFLCRKSKQIYFCVENLKNIIFVSKIETNLFLCRKSKPIYFCVENRNKFIFVSKIEANFCFS